MSLISLQVGRSTPERLATHTLKSAFQTQLKQGADDHQRTLCRHFVHQKLRVNDQLGALIERGECLGNSTRDAPEKEVGDPSMENPTPALAWCHHGHCSQSFFLTPTFPPKSNKREEPRLEHVFGRISSATNCTWTLVFSPACLWNQIGWTDTVVHLRAVYFILFFIYFIEHDVCNLNVIYHKKNV